VSEPYPTFDAALEHFRSFLTDNEQSADIQWVFRDHVYADRNTLYIAATIAESNTKFAAQAFHAGTTKDQVAVKAIARLPNATVATVWYPLTEQHRPQGWVQGLRYSIAKPLQHAVHVTGGWQWHFRKLGPAYRRYHRFAGDSILSTQELRSTIDPQHCEITE